MARNKVHEPDSDTTVVNIADFQRTRDSAGYVPLSQDVLARAMANEQRTAEMIHHLTDQLLRVIDFVVSTSYDRYSLTETYAKVIVALATLQNSVQDLSKAYINHANTVLSPGRAGTLDLNLATTLRESGLLEQRASPGMKLEAPADVKKKRKRAKHDPNAPKRALTPYFLYMQSARPKIAQELGPHARPKEVADEGTRRWTVMPEADKAVRLPFHAIKLATADCTKIWNDTYQANLAVYLVKTRAYKAGQPIPSNEEAEKLAQGEPLTAAVPVEEEFKEVEEEEDEDEEEDEGEDDVREIEEESQSESSPEPVRAPSPPKSSKRRKTSERQAATPNKETPKPSAASKVSTEKERDRKAKKYKKETSPPPAPKVAEKKKKSKKLI